MRFTFAGFAIVLMMSGAARAEILIGVSAAMTGSYSIYGEITLNGADTAVAELNANGGVLGEHVDVVIADDFCSGDQAVAAAQKLVSAGVVFVVGHPCSGGAIPASKIYDREQIVMISTTASNPRLTDEGGDFVFRIYGRDDQQGMIAGDMLAANWADADIAVVHDGEAYGMGLASHVKNRLDELGVRPRMFDQIQPGEADYSALVTRFEDAGIDILYYGGYATEAALIVSQLRSMGSEIMMVGGDGVGNTDFWDIADQAGEGTLVTFPPNLRQLEAARSILVDQLGFESQSPSDRALFALSAVQAWAQAAERVGTTDPLSVAAELRQAEFDTALGRIGFDQNGDITGFETFSWYIWQDGNLDDFQPN